MGKKIFINCAPNGIGHGSNFGMQTVDFAIHNILKDVNKTDHILLTTPWSAYSDDSETLPLKERDNFPTKLIYGLPQFDELSEGDAVFYWGDFQWGADYQVQSAYRLKKNILGEQHSKDDLKFKSIVENRFLLKDLFDKESEAIKIFSYGTTLFQNRLYDFLDQEYFNNLKWLIRKSSFIKFRDPYSANFCAAIRNDFKTSYEGVDATLLSTREELLSLPEGDKEFAEAFKGQIGYYFGRSSGAFPKYYVTKFVKELQTVLGKKLVRIPWTYFVKGLFADSMDKYFSFFRVSKESYKDSHFVSGDILKAIANCSIIITDTYHVAINAIAVGVPVLMVSEFRPSTKRDANMGYIESWRDKRVMLYLSNSLNDLLILPDLLKKPYYRKSKIQIVETLLANTNSLNVLFEPIWNKAKFDRGQIQNVLSSF